MRYPILLPNIFDHPFTYESDFELKIGDREHAKTSDSNLILLERGNKLTVRAYKKSEFL